MSSPPCFPPWLAVEAGDNSPVADKDRDRSLAEDKDTEAADRDRDRDTGTAVPLPEVVQVVEASPRHPTEVAEQELVVPAGLVQAVEKARSAVPLAQMHAAARAIPSRHLLQHDACST
jgi:hypothetical protein